MVDKKGENIISTIDQGLLKKWTEHSQELHPITPRGRMEVYFLDNELL